MSEQTPMADGDFGLWCSVDAIGPKMGVSSTRGGQLPATADAFKDHLLMEV